jgi:IgGFc binding protein
MRSRAVILGILTFVLALLACGTSAMPPFISSYGPASTEDAGGDAATPVLLGIGVDPNDDPTTCVQAAQLRSYVGCDYWPTVVANDVWSIFDFAVVVANAGTTPASVTITGPFGTNQAQTVQPDTVAKFFLPWVPALKGEDADSCGTAVPLAASVIAPASAYHLVSSVPVTVYQFNALEYAGIGGPAGKDWSSCPGLQSCNDADNPNDGTPVGCFSFTNDSSLLFPSTAMTGNYRVTAYSGESITSPTGGASAPVMNGYIAITATVAATHVKVVLSATAQVIAGGTVATTGPGGEIDLTLNAGDVAELAGVAGDTVDLSGTLVAADQPVQVIAGAPCDQVPESAPACDHLEQSVFPAETLGKQYFVTAPTGPLGYPVAHVVRLYGNVDGTTLAYLPAAPPGCPATLSAGQVVDCGVVTGDFEVTASNEIAIGSFMLGGSVVDPSGGLGDPSESLIAALEQYRTKYVFLAPDDYTVSAADIVVPVGARLELDGAVVDMTTLTAIAGGYGVLRMGLGTSEAHVLLASAPVGLQVMGYGLYTSYQYPGGLDLKQIAPPPPTPR